LKRYLSHFDPPIWTGSVAAIVLFAWCGGGLVIDFQLLLEI